MHHVRHPMTGSMESGTPEGREEDWAATRYRLIPRAGSSTGAGASSG